MRLSIVLTAAVIAVAGPVRAADPPPPQPATRNASSAKSAQELRAEKGWQTTEETAAGEGRVLRVFADSFPAENNIGTDEMIATLSIRCYSDRQLLINFMTTVNLVTLDQIQRYEPFTIEYRVDSQRRTSAPGMLVLPQVMMFRNVRDAQAFAAAVAGARRTIEVDAVTRVVRMPGRFAVTNVATAMRPVIEGCGRPPTS
jgi:hypothetical protein